MSSVMQMHDNMSLGKWVHSLRRQKRRNALPDWQRNRLDKLHFAWDVDQQTAWWHHHLHQARRYKVTLVTISLRTVLALKMPTALFAEVEYLFEDSMAVGNSTLARSLRSVIESIRPG